MPTSQPAPAPDPSGGPTPARSRARGLAMGCGALLIIIALLLAAVAVWLNRQQRLMRPQIAAAGEEGRRVGPGTDEAGCVDEGKRRALRVASMADGVRVGVFTRVCLEYSRETPGFCQNVPSPRSVRRSGAWRRERCGEDQACNAVIPVVQTYCTDGRRKLLQPHPGTPAASTPPADSAGG